MAPVHGCLPVSSVRSSCSAPRLAAPLCPQSTPSPRAAFLLLTESCLVTPWLPAWIFILSSVSPLVSTSTRAHKRAHTQAGFQKAALPPCHVILPTLVEFLFITDLDSIVKYSFELDELSVICSLTPETVGPAGRCWCQPAPSLA